MPALSWRHHTLIQALLSRGPLPEADFKSIFHVVTEKSPAAHQQLFNEFLRKINAELAYVQFELRACKNQYDGSVYYGVVNNVSDDQSKLGTKYSVPQIAFYKAMIEAIVQDGAEGSISKIQAINIRLENQVLNDSSSQSQTESTQVPAAFRNFSMSQKEKTIEELVGDSWLCLTSDGKVGLGVRSFLDLRSWFRSNEVPSCQFCNEAAVKVESCPNSNCNVRIHKYCLTMKFSQRKAEKVCPGCRTDWPFIIAKVEKVEEEDQVPRKKGRRTYQEVGTDNPRTTASQNTANSPARLTRRSSRLQSAS
ncbi:unnamed protein product [Cuscuta campestris]|uniref:Non-structural maintenance of chromosomes element 1 homolog n=1 Tax=Cuscuta campestris TaxID=132261 RepID=A0A484NP31_9ASTE|nr:unnamed protein product [Cuscuta campestris]